MNYKAITIIAIRILSIYVFIQFLIRLLNAASYFILPLFFDSLRDDLEVVNILFNVIPVTILFLSALFLWLYSEKIAIHIVPKETNAQTETNEQINIGKVESSFNYNLLQAMVFSVVGLIIIVLTIPEITRVIVQLLQYNEIGMEYAIEKYTIDTYSLLIEKVIKLILGFGLFFGGRGLTGLLNKIRSWG